MIISKLSKKEKRIFAGAFLFFLLFLLLLSTDRIFDWDSEVSTQKRIGIVMESGKDVRRKASKRYLWRRVDAKHEIRAGDSVFTGPDSELKLKLEDGSEMILQPNSLVAFNLNENQVDMNFRFGSVKVLAGVVKVNGSKLTTNTTYHAPAREKPHEDLAAKKAKESLQKLIAPHFTSPNLNYVHVNRRKEDGTWNSPRYFKITWAHERKMAQFEFQIIADQTTELVLFSTKLKRKEIVTPNMAAGLYLARVRELGPDSLLTSKWSAPMHIKIEDHEFNPGFDAPLLAKRKIQYQSPSPNLPEVHWSKVKKAFQYIFEMDTSPEFKDPRSTFVKSTEYTWKKYVRGKFYYRIYGATKKGTRGPASDIGELNINFVKPKIEPLLEKVVQAKSAEDPGDPLRFDVKWSQYQTADRYEIQISKDHNFSKPDRIETRTPASIVSVPKPGEYHWRVRPLTRTGEPLTPFSDTGVLHYKLRVPLVTPTPLEPAQNSTFFFQKRTTPVFWIEWSPVRQAEKYELEISTDLAFTKKLIHETTDQPRFLVDHKIPTGKVFWRVRAAGEGRISNWTDPQKLKIFSGRTSQVFQREAE